MKNNIVLVPFPFDVLLKKEDKISKGTRLIVDSVIKLHRIVTIPKRIIKRKLGEANTELAQIVSLNLNRLFELKL